MIGIPFGLMYSLFFFGFFYYCESGDACSCCEGAVLLLTVDIGNSSMWR